MSLLNLLFFGDLVGEAGLQIARLYVPALKNEYEADILVMNGENAHEGKGINEAIVKELFALGVDVITGGDHSFDKHLIFPFMKTEPRLLRPLNYPKGVYGFGYYLFTTRKQKKVGVINLRGQQFFNNPIDDPFRTADWIIEKLQQETKVLFVDFHAEATAEKLAFARYVDGRVSAIAGTHTHIQTADEQILPGGTGYITDVGFTGPHDSVIGMATEVALNRFLYQTPQKYKVAEEGLKINGLFVQVDEATGKTEYIERISIPDFPRGKKA